MIKPAPLDAWRYQKRRLLIWLWLHGQRSPKASKRGHLVQAVRI
jgi:hypothetical protein